jgi:hypothetical protein
MYRFLLPAIVAAAAVAVTLATNPAFAPLLTAGPPPSFPWSAAAFVVLAVVLFFGLAQRGRLAAFIRRHSRKLAVLALGGFALGLAACAGGPAVSDPSAIPLTIAKAEYGFEQSYNVAGNAYLAAVHAGLPAATKAKVKPMLEQAYAIVKDARAAQAIGDAAGVTAKTAALQTLVSQILAQLPAAPTMQQPLNSGGS